MIQHDVKTWAPQVLDNGKRVHLTYTGSGVLLPLIDFNSIKASADKPSITEEEARNIAIKEAKSIYNKGLADAPTVFAMKHKGQNRKQDCGCRGDAEIVAAAISGKSIKELQKMRFTYNKEGHRRVFGRTKIMDAIAVRGASDFQRIYKLSLDYPDVFVGITSEQLQAWIMKKLQKSAERGSK